MADATVFNGTGPDHMRNFSFNVNASWALVVSFACGDTNYLANVTVDEASFNHALFNFITQTGATGYGNVDYVGGVATTDWQRTRFARMLAEHFMSCLHLIIAEHPEDAAEYARYYHSHIVLSSHPYSTVIQKKVCAFMVSSGLWQPVKEFALTNWMPSGPAVDSGKENETR